MVVWGRAAAESGSGTVEAGSGQDRQRDGEAGAHAGDGHIGGLGGARVGMEMVMERPLTSRNANWRSSAWTSTATAL